MKRRAFLVAAVAAVSAGLVLSLRSRGASPEATAKGKPDSVWYHASDIATLAATGRPQLLEFFHPR